MTFASIIGMMIAGFVLLIIGISVIGGMVATTEVATVVKENSVYRRNGGYYRSGNCSEGKFCFRARP